MGRAVFTILWICWTAPSKPGRVAASVDYGESDFCATLNVDERHWYFMTFSRNIGAFKRREFPYASSTSSDAVMAGIVSNAKGANSINVNRLDPKARRREEPSIPFGWILLMMVA